MSNIIEILESAFEWYMVNFVDYDCDNIFAEDMYEEVQHD